MLQSVVASPSDAIFNLAGTSGVPTIAPVLGTLGLQTFTLNSLSIAPLLAADMTVTFTPYAGLASGVLSILNGATGGLLPSQLTGERDPYVITLTKSRPHTRGVPAASVQRHGGRHHCCLRHRACPQPPGPVAGPGKLLTMAPDCRSCYVTVIVWLPVTGLDQLNMKHDGSCRAGALQYAIDDVCISASAAPPTAGSVGISGSVSIGGPGPSTPSSTPSVTPAATPSGTPSAGGGATPSGTPGATPAATPSASSGDTPSGTPSASPAGTPTAGATSTASPTGAPSAAPSSIPSAGPAFPTAGSTPSTGGGDAPSAPTGSAPTAGGGAPAAGSTPTAATPSGPAADGSAAPPTAGGTTSAICPTGSIVNDFETDTVSLGITSRPSCNTMWMTQGRVLRQWMCWLIFWEHRSCLWSIRYVESNKLLT